MLLSTVEEGDVMDFRITILLAVLCSSCAVANPKYEYINEVKYAVSYCLSKTYKGSSFSSDAAHISGAYLQKGGYGLDMYESVRDFVDSYLQKKYMSKHGKNLEIMQCIDLSASSELMDLIQEVAGH